jgi:hypothetical protein
MGGTDRKTPQPHAVGLLAMWAAKRCGAKTRQGTPCKQAAMKNGRCRMHGGKTPIGEQSANFKHGRRTKAAKAFRVEAQSTRWLIQQMTRRLKP